ncbi:hypothetical protein [Burkholderia anthina]|uniref:hypothetical protein n=1 Tax=Burkholderia anthina TaxID=179879 RepID=UPI000757496A|nr:hypothetical protein [Burkholderia anthina]KVE08413.1 hypothetical protein WS65_09345 [Burkholderia anthina]
MRELPILFSGPMVRALLEGRKTQTRRVVKVRNELPPAWATYASEGHSLMQDGKARPVGSFFWSEEQQPEQPLQTLRRWPVLPAKHPMAGDWYWTPSPYGKIGDRLWVRETCRADELDSGLDGVRYQADDAFRAIEDSLLAAERWLDLNAYRGREGATVPAIHMPRWASRITLEITGVRAERLQSISESDARAEGVTIADHHMRGYCAGAYRPPSIRAFHDLWDSLNAARGHGWDMNPWVWVVEFRRIER